MLIINEETQSSNIGPQSTFGINKNSNPYPLPDTYMFASPDEDLKKSKKKNKEMLKSMKLSESKDNQISLFSNENKEETEKEEKSIMGQIGVKVPVEEIKQYISKIPIRNSIMSVSDEGYLTSVSNNIKFGAPNIKLGFNQNINGYRIGVVLNSNLNNIIESDLIEFMEDKLDLQHKSGNMNGLVWNKDYPNIPFNKAYPTYRKIISAVNSFILNHEIFQNSSKNKK